MDLEQFDHEKQDSIDEHTKNQANAKVALFKYAFFCIFYRNGGHTFVWQTSDALALGGISAACNRLCTACGGQLCLVFVPE